MAMAKATCRADELSVDEVVDIVKAMFPQYESRFKTQHVDGSALTTLTHKKLRDELGILSLGHRVTILKKIEELGRLPPRAAHEDTRKSFSYQVTKVIPESGTVLGGFEVAVIGKNFVPGINICFGDTEVKGNLHSSELVTCICPPVEYPGEVTVTAGGDVSGVAFTFIPAPDEAMLQKPLAGNEWSLEPDVLTLYVIGGVGEDLHERDMLLNEIIPELRESCRHRRVRLQVSPLCLCPLADAQDEHIIEKKLHQLEESDIVLGFVSQNKGEPVGHHYNPIASESYANACKALPWMSSLSEHTMTDVEIRHITGIGQGGRSSHLRATTAIFFCRKQSQLDLSRGHDSLSLSVSALSHDESALTSGNDYLINLFHKHNVPITWYSDSEFASVASACLKERLHLLSSSVSSYHQQPTAHVTSHGSVVVPSSEQLLRRHRSFGDCFILSYVPRTLEHEALDAAVAESTRPIVVCGAQGIGKTALLVNWSRERVKSHCQDALIAHFTETSDACMYLPYVFRFIAAEMGRFFPHIRSMEESSYRKRANLEVNFGTTGGSMGNGQRGGGRAQLVDTGDWDSLDLVNEAAHLVEVVEAHTRVSNVKIQIVIDGWEKLSGDYGGKTEYPWQRYAESGAGGLSGDGRARGVSVGMSPMRGDAHALPFSRSSSSQVSTQALFQSPDEVGMFSSLDDPQSEISIDDSDEDSDREDDGGEAVLRHAQTIRRGLKPGQTEMEYVAVVLERLAAHDNVSVVLSCQVPEPLWGKRNWDKVTVGPLSVSNRLEMSEKLAAEVSDSKHLVGHDKIKSFLSEEATGPIGRGNPHFIQSLMTELARSPRGIEALENEGGSGNDTISPATKTTIDSVASPLQRSLRTSDAASTVSSPILSGLNGGMAYRAGPSLGWLEGDKCLACPNTANVFSLMCAITLRVTDDEEDIRKCHITREALRFLYVSHNGLTLEELAGLLNTPRRNINIALSRLSNTLVRRNGGSTEVVGRCLEEEQNTLLVARSVNGLLMYGGSRDSQTSGIGNGVEATASSTCRPKLYLRSSISRAAVERCLLSMTNLKEKYRDRLSMFFLSDNSAVTNSRRLQQLSSMQLHLPTLKSLMRMCERRMKLSVDPLTSSKLASPSLTVSVVLVYIGKRVVSSLRAKVQALREAIQLRLNCRCWFQGEGQTASDAMSLISTCKIVIPCISHHFVPNSQCHKEIETALEWGKAFVPCKLEAELPWPPTGAFGFIFRGISCVDISQAKGLAWEDAVDTMCMKMREFL